MANIFRPSRPEMGVLRKNFLESCKILGRTCILIQPTLRTLDKYTTSDKYDYTNAIEYPYFIHFQAEPKKKMLELFGFSAESTDARPLLADCPYYRYPKFGESIANAQQVLATKVFPVALSEGCLIKIEMYDWAVDTVRVETYEVEKVISGDDRVNYIINLVPYRALTTGVELVDKPDSGSSFIKQSDE
jgi:hypothetical protein